MINYHSFLDPIIELKCFGELEADSPIADTFPVEDKACQRIYESTFSRDETGKYVLKVPFKSETTFGDIRILALKRFDILKRKLERIYFSQICK